jgi:hypothetical protein
MRYNVGRMSESKWKSWLSSGLKKATERGFSLSEISRATDISRKSLQQFKDRGYLGGEKSRRLESWLRDKDLLDSRDHGEVNHSPSQERSDLTRAGQAERDCLCPGCGKYTVGPEQGAVFCSFCGASLGKACTNCGHLNIDRSARLCTICGVQLPSISR